MVGPVPQGVSKFVLTAEAPDQSLIPVSDLVGVTVVLITCSYREKEFVRIGYYVNNESVPPHHSALFLFFSFSSPARGGLEESCEGGGGGGG